MVARVIGAVVLGLLSVGLCTANGYGTAPDIVGTYDTVSTVSNGKKLVGTVEITLKQGKSYNLKWKWDGEKRHDLGLGQLQGEKLNVTYQRAKVDTKGTAEYTLQKDGSLTGPWEETNPKTGTVKGTETMTPKK